jgi:tight adherence protein C
MTLVLPVLTFALILGTCLIVNRRGQRTVAHLGRHQIAGTPVAIAFPQPRTQIGNFGQSTGSAGRLASRITRRGVQAKSRELLLEAGSPMTVAGYLSLRLIFMCGWTPLYLLFLFNAFGITLLGIVMIVVGGFTIPNLPLLRIKRKARKRARSIEHAMPDAIDLLVVCAEGGLSLDGALQQVSRRTEGVLAVELQRLLGEIGSGMGRRDAFAALTERSQSESLKIFCSTMIQADKMGMSIATTLRTLAETMRTRRRQAAETQARKAPIKMMPFLVIFMVPSLFIVILGPAVISIIGFMRDISKM